jgi:hypothetical protein
VSPEKTCDDSAVLDLTSPLHPPPPPKKKIHNHPKHLLIKTSPHQCDVPGIDPMSSPHLRINCADPTEDSCPGRITVRVLASSRTRLSKVSCHCTGTASVVFPQTNATATRALTMRHVPSRYQSYPLIRPGPGVIPPIPSSFLTPARSGLPEGRILKGHLFCLYTVE